MRATAPTLILMSFAALAQLVPACHKQSFSDYPPGNDASSDGSREASGSSGGGLGDDGAPLDVSYLDDTSSGGGTCALPSGTFAVTATPDADADPVCMPWSSTVTFPPSTKPNDAGVSCSYTPSGSPPVCAVSFLCQGYEEGGTLTTTIGNIQVDGTAIAGTEEIQMPTGDETETTCNYTLDYVKQ